MRPRRPRTWALAAAAVSAGLLAGVGAGARGQSPGGGRDCSTFAFTVFTDGTDDHEYTRARVEQTPVVGGSPPTGPVDVEPGEQTGLRPPDRLDLVGAAFRYVDDGSGGYRLVADIRVQDLSGTEMPAGAKSLEWELSFKSDEQKWLLRVEYEPETGYSYRYMPVGGTFEKTGGRDDQASDLLRIDVPVAAMGLAGKRLTDFTAQSRYVHKQTLPEPPQPDPIAVPTVTPLPPPVPDKVDVRVPVNAPTVRPTPSVADVADTLTADALELVECAPRETTTTPTDTQTTGGQTQTAPPEPPGPPGGSTPPPGGGARPEPPSGKRETGPGGGPASKAAAAIRVRPGRLSARAIARRRALTLRLEATETVTAVRGTLRRRGSARAVAAGTRARLAGAGPLVLRWRGRRVQPGRYALALTARDASGKALRATAALRIRR